MNKNERKSQNSVGLFKTKAHLKYLQDLARSYISAPCPSIFDGSISSRRALTQKIIDKIVIVYYKFDGNFFSIIVLEYIVS